MTRRQAALAVSVVLVATLTMATRASGTPPEPVPSTDLVPSGMSGSTPGHSMASVSYRAPDNIWAAGSRTADGTHQLTWVRHWDGVHWTSEHTPNPGRYDSELYGISAVSRSDVWTVGTMRNSADGPPLQLVEHWDGQSWSVVTAPRRAGSLAAVEATKSGDVWAVGVANLGAVLEHWDGAIWRVFHPVAPPVQSPWQVTAMVFYGIEAVTKNDIWAVGSYDAEDGNGEFMRQPLIEQWNGREWTIASLPTQPGLASVYDIDELAPDDIWAVGTDDLGTEADTLVEHWDGQSWTAQTASYGDGTHYALQGVRGISADDVWAVGAWTEASQTHMVTQHWDGTAWTVVPADEPSPHHDYLSSVAGDSTDNVIAVGGFLRGAKSRGVVERWDGTAWQVDR